MNKRTIFIITSLVVVGLLAAGAYAYFSNQPNDKKQNRNNNSSTNSTNSGTKPGDRYVLIDTWDVKFKLPARIDVTETKLVLQQTDRYDTMNILSRKLPDQLNTDMCSGTTLSMGSFLEISRYNQPDDDGDNSRKKIGNYYYYVSDEFASSACYPKATYEKYFSDDVVDVVRQTLTKQ